MQKTPSKIIAITGAESTGKSSLSQKLAQHYNATSIPEYARTYIENLDRPYHYEDVVSIAKQQVAQLEEAKKSENKIIFLDTWLIITKVWFDEVFGRIPEWLETSITETPIDLYLICDTNLPWVKDALRENGGENRERLQKRYMDEILKYNFKGRIVGSKGQERLQNAINFVDEAINPQPI